MLSIQDLFFRYRNINALEGVGITLNKGEILSIVGPNGAGKTTLLKCILRIVKPDSCIILIDGRDASRMKRRDLAKILGYMPQGSPSRFPVTVFEAVLMGRRPYIVWKPSKKDLEVVADLLRSMDLEDIALRYLDRLSGGQEQKVMLARAFAQDADYLLLDEPTSNLDLRHQMEVMQMISSMVKQNKMAAIVAMHDLNLASRFSDRMVMLKAGRIFCSGEPQHVMTESNIRSVYGVEAIIDQNNGHPYILPIRPVNQQEK